MYMYMYLQVRIHWYIFHDVFSSFAGYDIVLSHLVDITNVLKTALGAKRNLTAHFIQNRWMAITQNPSESELVVLALQRIKIDPSQYDIFLDMLRSIPEFELIVNALSHGEFLSF